MSISLRGRDIRARAPQGRVGDLAVYDNDVVERSYLNTNAQASQVSTITVGTATDNYAYTVTIDGVSATYTSGSSSSTTTVAAGIAAAINAEPEMGGMVYATSSSAVVTVTGRTPGLAFTLESADDGGKVTDATTTSAAEAEAVPFGRGVASVAYETNEADELAVLVSSDLLTAQVDTYTITYDASVIISASITINGETYTASHTMATDLATSITALVAAINLAMPATTVIAAATATTFTLTAEVDGLPFVSAVSFGSGADTGAAVKTTTAGTVSTDITRAFRGVAKWVSNTESATPGSSVGQYDGNEPMVVIERGRVWVANSQSPTFGQAVYIGTTLTEKGKFFNSSGSGRVLLPRTRAVWARDERTSASDGIAVLTLL